MNTQQPKEMNREMRRYGRKNKKSKINRFSLFI